MNKLNKVSIKFGVPDHGWLPTEFRHRSIDLELEISDVPLDPMVQLCDALIEIAKGINEPSRITWHLEPYCYYLQFRRSKNQFQAIISESDHYDSPAKINTTITGTFEEIILPCFRALKAFWSKAYKSPHWEELEPKRIEELTKLVRENKDR